MILLKTAEFFSASTLTHNLISIKELSEYSDMWPWANKYDKLCATISRVISEPHLRRVSTILAILGNASKMVSFSVSFGKFSMVPWASVLDNDLEWKCLMCAHIVWQQSSKTFGAWSSSDDTQLQWWIRKGTSQKIRRKINLEGYLFDMPNIIKCQSNVAKWRWQKFDLLKS